MIRLFGFLLFVFFSARSFAADYVFTGAGNWNNAANWQGNLIPPSNLQSGNTITIQGQAFVGDASCPRFSFCADPGTFQGNFGGKIIIALNGSLALNNNTQFSNGGELIINGTFTNNTTFEGYNTGSVTVNGTLINKFNFGNQGVITVNSGGVIRNEATGVLTNFEFPYPGTITINSGGLLKNEGSAILRLNAAITNNGVIENTAILTGNATISGHLDNAGTLAPGNSPGVITVGGNYTATSTAIHQFEVRGTTAADYDRLVVNGNVTLQGTLNISLLNGFEPATGHPDLPIITGTINGTFTTVNIPSQYQLVYDNNQVALRIAASLPVVFSQVDVQKEGTGAKLVWHIQTETNVLRYEVEKSDNGRDFRTIGEVLAAGSSLYRFLDPVPGQHAFYRIKGVEQNGKPTYSIVMAYHRGTAGVPVAAFPSPAKGEIAVQHSTATTKNRIVISGMDGRILKTVFPANGAQKTTLNVHSFPAGTYLLQYYHGGMLEGSSRFVIQ